MRVATQVAERAQSVRDAVALTVVFCLFTLVVFTVSGFFRGPDAFREALTIGVPMMVVDGFLGFQLYHVLRWTADLKPAPRWGLLMVAIVAVALVQAAWDTQLRIWAETITVPYRQQFVRSATLNTYNSGMLAALLAFQAAFVQLKRQQVLLELARQHEREAQMLALRFQLNPHFLFNTLNAISGLVVTGRTGEAEGMISKLSSFLRASLSADPERMVALEDEFEMLETYLDIEGVRFGERLAAAIDLPAALADAQIPPFLLQPLVENSVKYAVAPSREPVEVRIAARACDGVLELEVGDSGPAGAGGAVPKTGTGVGLANVRERLRLSYGDAGRMAVHRDADGFRIVLAMPLLRREVSAAPPATIAA